MCNVLFSYFKNFSREMIFVLILYVTNNVKQHLIYYIEMHLIMHHAKKAYGGVTV
jgi:hypothetical protein